MKSKWMRVVLGCTLVMTVGMMTGCGSKAEVPATEAPVAEVPAAEEPVAEAPAEEPVAEEPAAESAISGTITMAGSTSMEKFANALSEVYMQKNPGVTMTAEFIGSSAGIESLLAGSVDIGNASRELKDTEKEAGAVENIVAMDGIAVVVDKANTVTDLKQEDLVAIYTGAVTNWSELGGENVPIVVIGRESGSGTRGAFEELLKIEDKCKYSNELDSTGAVMAKVASTPGGIGYVSLDVIDDTVKVLTLDGVAAKADTIKDGTYLLSRPFVMATKGEISAQSDAVKNMFEFLKSDEGKELIQSVGLITLD